VPADVRETLAGAAPVRVPELDFDRLWRRHQQARTRRAAAALAALLAVLVTVSGIQWGPTVELQPAAPSQVPFVGTWESVDLDGSHQHMTILLTEDGTYRVDAVDDHSTACEAMPASTSGTGTLAAGTRMAIAQTYTCEDGTVLREVEGIRLDEWALVHDPATDSLQDPTGVLWYREGAQRALIPNPIPDDVITETSQTPLGTWTWTWVPQGQGAARLWNQALRRLGPGRIDSVRDRLPPSRGPQTTGMTWGDWWEERSARLGNVSVAAVSRPAEIDWSVVYDFDVWAVWRHGSSTTVEIQEEVSWGGPVVTTLEVSLAPGDPAAIEFHDRDTAEVVLRLEATDPAVSAEQLIRFVHWSLLIDEGDGFRELPAPWQGLPIDWADVTAWNDGFLAVGVGPADWPAGDLTPLLYRWASSDGVRWDPSGHPLPLPLKSGVGSLELLGDESRLFLKLAGHEETASLWTSTDGVAWRRVGPDANLSFIHVTKTTFGWVLTSMDRGCRVWLSAEGVHWEEPVPLENDFVHQSGVEAVQCSVIGDEVYAVIEAVPSRPLGLLIGAFTE
jgi:hypothetical protein